MADPKEKKALDPEALAAENAALKEQLASAQQLADTGGFSAEDLELVRYKTEAGLTPDQAREVVRAQKLHDAKLAAK